jgi:hypothetical protein
MTRKVKAKLDQLNSPDRMEQHEAFLWLMKATESRVNWSYEAWDRFVHKLTDPNNRQRAIGAQVLCNLAKSDPDKRIVQAFPALVQVTRDKRPMTARRSLQSLWKVGLAGPDQLALVLQAYETRFGECVAGENTGSVRSDILRGMKTLQDGSGDPRIERLAKKLIQTEADRKLRKKYLVLWRKIGGQ